MTQSYLELELELELELLVLLRLRLPLDLLAVLRDEVASTALISDAN